MHVVPVRHPGYRLVGRDGSNRFFANAEALRAWIVEARARVGAAFDRCHHVPYVGWVGEISHAVRDGFGDPIDPAELERILLERIFRSRRPCRYRFRLGPVPGTRCFRGGSSFFRHPRTTNEIRHRDSWDEELRALGFDPRRVGRRRRLVTAYDDIPRNLGDRSWKRQGKPRQWCRC